MELRKTYFSPPAERPPISLVTSRSLFAVTAGALSPLRFARAAGSVLEKEKYVLTTQERKREIGALLPEMPKMWFMERLFAFLKDASIMDALKT